MKDQRLPITINGKIYPDITCPDFSWAFATQCHCRDNAEIQKILNGREIRNIEVKPGKLVNIITWGRKKGREDSHLSDGGPDKTNAGS